MATLLVEISDPSCMEGFSYQHLLKAEDTTAQEIASAVVVLYPDWTEFRIVKNGEEE